MSPTADPRRQAGRRAARGPRARALLSDRRGVAAVEFALVLPLLVLIFFGVTCTGLLVTVDRKVNDIAFTVGDLTSQASTLSQSQVCDIFSVGSTLLPTSLQGDLTMRVMDVAAVGQNGVVTSAQVGWCMSNAPSGTLLSCPAVGTPLPNFPLNLLPGTTSSIIQSDVRDNFTQPSYGFFPNGVGLQGTQYLNPRQSSSVTYTGQSGGSC